MPAGPASGAGSSASPGVAEPRKSVGWWSDWSLQSTLPHWIGLEGSIHPDQVDQNSLVSAVVHGIPRVAPGDAAHYVSSTSSVRHVPMMAMISDHCGRSAERTALCLSLLPPPDGGASSKLHVGATALYGLRLPTRRCKVEVSIAYQLSTSVAVGASPDVAASSGQRAISGWVVPMLLAGTDPPNFVCLPGQGVKLSQYTDLFTCTVGFDLKR